MLFRSFLLFLMMFSGISTLLWVVFRSNIITRKVVTETIKSGTIVLTSVITSLFLIALLVFLERSL